MEAFPFINACCIPRFGRAEKALKMVKIPRFYSSIYFVWVRVIWNFIIILVSRINGIVSLSLFAGLQYNSLVVQIHGLNILLTTYILA